MRKAGIWQGRFQYVHKGHYHVFKDELLKFQEKFIAIVNPNPSNPAYDFERFDKEYNPFTYFQRMLIWKKIAEHCETTVNFFPCWHAKKYIALENEFLPRRGVRSWIVPVTQSLAEERKAKDLKTHGEDIHEANYRNESAEVAAINASLIRASIREGSELYTTYIPECVLDLTKDLINGVDNTRYYIVPYIGDTIDVYSLQYALDCIRCEIENGQNAYLVVAIMVKVKDNTPERWIDEGCLPWWFQTAEHDNDDDRWTYYTKMQLITELMKKEKEQHYLLTPLFLKKETFLALSDYCNAFLPTLNEENVFWVINQDIPKYYKYAFNNYLRNNEFQVITCSSQNVKIQNPIAEYFSGDNRAFVSDNTYLSKNTVEGARAALKYTIDKGDKAIDELVKVCLDKYRDIRGLDDEEKKQFYGKTYTIQSTHEEWEAFIKKLIQQLAVSEEIDLLEKDFAEKMLEIKERLEEV